MRRPSLAVLLVLALALACMRAPAQPPAPAAAAAASASVSTSADYVLGPGDRIRVTVFQSPELSIDTRIPESGVVAYPLVGDLALGGKTLSQAEKRVAEGLVAARLVRVPQVAIVVTEIHANQAAVLGFVVHPGRYALEARSMRLSGLIALAGGPTPEASDILTVTGTRDGKPMRLAVDTRRLLTGADRDHDIEIRNGDIVYLERAPQVYVHGEVQHPGTLRLEPGMRVLQAIAAAGGVTMRGTKRGIRVSRPGPDGALVDSTPGLQAVLEPDDVVYVPESLF
ncbi:MAG: polysaccharide biosynthesis/export family protein [Burkholderiaceae bacterium]